MLLLLLLPSTTLEALLTCTPYMGDHTLIVQGQGEEVQVAWGLRRGWRRGTREGKITRDSLACN